MTRPRLGHPILSNLLFGLDTLEALLHGVAIKDIAAEASLRRLLIEQTSGNRALDAFSSLNSGNQTSVASGADRLVLVVEGSGHAVLTDLSGVLEINASLSVLVWVATLADEAIGLVGSADVDLKDAVLLWVSKLDTFCSVSGGLKGVLALAPSTLGGDSGDSLVDDAAVISWELSSASTGSGWLASEAVLASTELEQLASSGIGESKGSDSE